MSDQGVWFKLWVGADDDPDLGNLSLEDFGRWCRLGLYLKKHGTGGAVTLRHPAFPLQQRFRVSSFEEVVSCLSKFPNCGIEVRTEVSTEASVTLGTILTVTYRNWAKYQGDYSTPRVRKLREMKRSKRRGEEMRREVTNTEGDLHSPNKPNRPTKTTAPEDPAFQAFYASYPRRQNRAAAWKAWQRLAPENGLAERILAAVAEHAAMWQHEHREPQHIPLPATWLNGKRWEDETTSTAPVDDPYAGYPRF